MEVDAIIWDEAPMSPKLALEAIDDLLRDLMQSDDPFGGKQMILGGDFRQIPPVVWVPKDKYNFVDNVVYTELLA